MSVLAEAKKWLEEMREHTDCCGTPIMRKLVAQNERLQRALATVAGNLEGTPSAERLVAIREYLSTEITQ